MTDRGAASALVVDDTIPSATTMVRTRNARWIGFIAIASHRNCRAEATALGCTRTTRETSGIRVFKHVPCVDPSARAPRYRQSRHEVIATAATGEAVRESLGLDVRMLLHGPAGGDAHACALIATGAADVLVSCWESLEVQPTTEDVKALLRLSVCRAVLTSILRTFPIH